MEEERGGGYEGWKTVEAGTVGRHRADSLARSAAGGFVFISHGRRRRRSHFNGFSNSDLVGEAAFDGGEGQGGRRTRERERGGIMGH